MYPNSTQRKEPNILKSDKGFTLFVSSIRFLSGFNQDMIGGRQIKRNKGVLAQKKNIFHMIRWPARGSLALVTKALALWKFTIMHTNGYNHIDFLGCN